MKSVVKISRREKKSQRKVKKFAFWIVLFSFSFFVFHSPGAYADTVTFTVDTSYDSQGRSEVSASLRYEGSNAYWYVSDQYWAGLTPSGRASLTEDIRNLSAEFDAVIYPRLRDVFGSENKPGVDGDPKITILLTRMIQDAGGYLREQDGFPKEKISVSNAREMVNLNVLHIGTKRAKSFLAHEFQHLITLNQKVLQRSVREEIWLNELRSEIAPTLLGYDSVDVYNESNLKARVDGFLQEPSDAILDWENEPKDYTSINLFGQYILDHYGRSVIAHMMRTDKAGIESFNEALSFFGFSETFSDVYTNWTIAALVNDCSLAPVDTYCYKNPSLRDFRLRFGFPDSTGRTVSSRGTTKDWRAEWNRFETSIKSERPQDHVFRLDFSFPSTSNFRVVYVAYDRDGLVVDVKELVLADGNGLFVLADFGFLLSKVVVISANQSVQKEARGSEAPSVPFLMTATTAAAIPEDYIARQSVSEVGAQPEPAEKPIAAMDPAPSSSGSDLAGQLPDLPDGSLIRAEGDYKVYIIKGPYKRWIQSAEIFDFYGHLNFAVVNVLPAETVALYTDAWLVRASDDTKVYEINGDGTRHWLDISAEEFSASGRIWDMVYLINKSELLWYIEGSSVR